MADIDNSEDIMDSRDVIARIEELEGELSAIEEALEEAQDAYEAELSDFEDRDPIEQHNGVDPSGELGDDFAMPRKEKADWLASDSPAELATLKAFAEQLEGYGDWHHGETLIRESYFVEYCQELVSDIGDMPREIPSYIVIDWEATASNLKVDYTESELDGVTYYMRA